MDQLDKPEMIILGMIKQKKAGRERSKDKVSILHVQRRDNEIDMPSWVWTEIDAVRRSAPGVSDEIVMKIYGPSKVV
jgi:hypothetical protein